MTEHNVLYIIEGKTEHDFLRRMWNRFEPDNGYDEYIYNTNVHVLMNLLYGDGDVLDEDLDIVRLLKSEETDEAKRKILSKKFEYVYLVFDLDPQDTKTDLARLSEMMDFFNDPADNGRLYLNYPMMESFRHLKSLDDDGFMDRKVGIPVLIQGRYKELVNSECCNELKQLNRYTREMFTYLIKMHLCKENHIINGAGGLMSKDCFLEMTGSELLKKQIELIETENAVFVINTCLFIMAEYRPSLFFP